MRWFLTIVSLAKISVLFAQPVNYVANPSFEAIDSCRVGFQNAMGWINFDSTYTWPFSFKVASRCNAVVPNIQYGYQEPRTGNNLSTGSILSEPPWQTTSARMYLRNRLKSTLDVGVTYCVRYFVNLTNYSPYATDRFEAYFGGNETNTISLSTYTTPLTMFTPQVSNPALNFVIDTLNWVAITGTFVAGLNQKYMVIGNFKDSANTNLLLVRPGYSLVSVSDVYIDDVSVVPIDLPAFAGADKRFISGDSVFIGREPDVGIDDACTWYKLPNMATPIAAIAGLYVKPVTTSTYVLRQQLWCSGVKYDTVVVYEDAVGFEKLKIINEELKISPNPATNAILLSLANGKLSDYFQRIEILDVQGQVLQAQEIADGETSSTLSIVDLANGIYLLRLRDAENEKVIVRKLAVQR